MCQTLRLSFEHGRGHPSLRMEGKAVQNKRGYRDDVLQ